jgi:hypothetical protein
MDRRDFLATSALALVVCAFPAVAARDSRRGASKWFDDRAQLMAYLRSTLGVPLEVRSLKQAGGHSIEQIFADVPDAQAGYVGFWMPELKMGAAIGPNVEEAAQLLASVGSPAFADNRHR